jgi:polyferredoxin
MVGLTTSLIGGFMNIWPGILISIFFLSAIAGNFYCGWICPFGSIQEWLGKLGSLFMKQKLHMPRKFQQVLQFSRYLVYAFLSLSAAMGIAGALSQSSSFNSNYYFLSLSNADNILQLSQLVSIPAMVFMTIYLVTALFFDRPFCNYLCPDAVKYSLLSFMRVFTIRRNSNHCVGCNKCSHACPMQIDVAHAHNLRNANCIHCMQCVASCPIKNTLSYGFCKRQTPEISTCEETYNPASICKHKTL